MLKVNSILSSVDRPSPASATLFACDATSTCGCPLTNAADSSAFTVMGNSVT